MKRLNKILSIITISTLIVVSIVGCSDKNKESKSKKQSYNIGIIQYVQHESLDAAHDGFLTALKDEGIDYELDDQNASGETASCQTIAETLVNNNNDLIFAIATPAAQAVASITEDIPIVVSAVTDPADAELVDSNENPGKNVTGTSDLTPVTEQIELLKDLLPQAKKVGILYCSAESNSALQAEMARKACEENGLESEDYTISSTNEIQTVVESMIGKVDVIYAPTDNMIAAGMATVSQVATENKIPVICGAEGMVEKGGLGTYGIDYYELGYKAGQMAADILKGKSKPEDMAIEYQEAEKCKLTINKTIAEELGIDISKYADSNIVESK